MFLPVKLGRIAAIDENGSFGGAHRIRRQRLGLALGQPRQLDVHPGSIFQQECEGGLITGLGTLHQFRPCLERTRRLVTAPLEFLGPMLGLRDHFVGFPMNEVRGDPLKPRDVPERIVITCLAQCACRKGVIRVPDCSDHASQTSGITPPIMTKSIALTEAEKSRELDVHLRPGAVVYCCNQLLADDQRLQQIEDRLYLRIQNQRLASPTSIYEQQESTRFSV